MNTDLRDRLFLRMAESDRPWTAEEIAREALKIVSDAIRAERLVTAILDRDPRFERLVDSTWRVRVRPAPRLADLALVVADVPPVVDGEAPLFLEAHEPKRRLSGSGEILTVFREGADLSRLVALLQGRLLVSLSAVAVRRRLNQIERENAIAASSERLLDLSACAKLAGLPLPDPLVRASVATVEDRMYAIRGLLDGVLDRIGVHTLDEIETLIEESPGAREVDFSPFRFGREDLARIPSRPGLYRFHGAGRELLYVGKSRDLRRRVGSYFRPLAPDHQRRATLLQAVRDLEWETTPSELEALLLEFEAIRRERPVFNKQIEIHAPPAMGSARDADLAFVLCEGDPYEVSAFLFRDRVPWAWGRLPRARVEETRAAALVMAEVWKAGRITPASGLSLLDEAGRGLVLRFLALHRDGLDHCNACDFGGLDGVAAALAELASRERPAWEPWTLRGSADPL